MCQKWCFFRQKQACTFFEGYFRKYVPFFLLTLCSIWGHSYESPFKYLQILFFALYDTTSFYKNQKINSQGKFDEKSLFWWHFFVKTRIRWHGFFALYMLRRCCQWPNPMHVMVYCPHMTNNFLMLINFEIQLWIFCTFSVICIFPKKNVQFKIEVKDVTSVTKSWNISLKISRFLINFFLWHFHPSLWSGLRHLILQLFCFYK